MTLVQRLARGGRRLFVRRRPAPHTLTTRPAVSAQPDVEAELLSAVKAAEQDASGVFDVPSMLAVEAPLPYADRCAAELTRWRAEARLRARHAEIVAEAQVLDMSAGRDATAAEPAVGIAAYRERRAARQTDVAEAEERVADSAERVEARGAALPAGSGPLTGLRLWLDVWALKLAFAAVDVVVASQSIGAAVASSGDAIAPRLPFVTDAKALAVVAAVGLVTLGTCVGTAPRRLADGHPRRLVVGTAVGCAALIVSMIVVVAKVRAVGLTVQAAAAKAGGATGDLVLGSSAPATVHRASPTTAGVFVAVLLLVSAAAVIAQRIVSDGPEKLAFWRAVRARDAARRRSEATVQQVEAFQERLDFADHDIAAAAQDAEHYPQQVLPALAAEKYRVYLDELQRRAGDPAFTDAVRAVPQPAPVTVAAAVA
jgi:hypothetical protein